MRSTQFWPHPTARLLRIALAPFRSVEFSAGACSLGVWGDPLKARSDPQNTRTTTHMHMHTGWLNPLTGHGVLTMDLDHGWVGSLLVSLTQEYLRQNAKTTRRNKAPRRSPRPLGREPAQHREIPGSEKPKSHGFGGWIFRGRPGNALDIRIRWLE